MAAKKVPLDDSLLYLGSDGGSDFRLIPVDKGAVDVAVPNVDGILHRLCHFTRL